MKKLISIIVFFSTCFVHAQVKVQLLRCERLSNPQGIDVVRPKLSWEIFSSQRNVQQTSYTILVASSKEKLEKNQVDVWNSGKVLSNESINVVYGGKPLQSRMHCFWKVKIVTNKGMSSWSDIATFSIGLLQQKDWEAKWIGYDKVSPWDSIKPHSRLSARYFRKEFNSSVEVRKAIVYISGLGLYELFINGNKVSNAVLKPAPTDYRKAVFYNTYDVTAQLKKGNNAIATILSNGRYFTMRQAYKPYKIANFGFPKLLLQLEIEYTNGSKKTIISDASWKLHVDGPVRTANEYDGEEYDATKEWKGWMNSGFDDRNWIKPQLVQAPGGILQAQMNEPMKVMQVIHPKSITAINDGKYILDLGQNFSGWLQLKAQGKRGQKITLRFAESLQKNGLLYVANLRDAKATDVYTMKGGGIETWHPSFVFHGFRYVEISGYPGTPTINDFEGQVVYDAISTTGTLQTSDTIINKIIKNAWWGIASNYKGMPIDCPQRNERQPWLGDRATGCYSESYLFDNENLYNKWLNDIEESQTKDGAIPDVAPAFWNYYSDNVTWPGTYLMVANMLYQQYGNERAIIQHYASMKKWMWYMRQKFMKNNIITKDKYGDWCVPPESLELIHARDSSLNTNGELIATSYYYYFLNSMKRFATIARQYQDTAEYIDLATKVRDAFNASFYHPEKKYFSNNTVTANLLPLTFGMVPVEDERVVFDQIINKLKASNYHISSGVIGVQWLMRCLTNYNRMDIAYTLASNKTYPSWGYMTENGATTIWELWNGNTANPQMNSQNHVMLLGDLLIWMFESVGGIQSDSKEVAFKKIIMRPVMTEKLTYASASYHSVYGEIKSDWNKRGDHFEWSMSVPSNTTAQVYIPANSIKSVWESNIPIQAVKDVTVVAFKDNQVLLSVGSGSYHFSSILK